MAKNKNMIKARKEKNDEFYTQLSDIENELKHYKDHFKDKIIYCNCDDPEWSNFWKYFKDDFNILGIKKLISTFINFNGSSIKTELELIDGNLIETKTPLIGNGDFRSPECIEILKECDIVVTNPPFSLFKEFLPLLVKYDKKFLIIGNQNAITYKDVFPHIKNRKIWLGYGFNGGATHFINKHYEDYAVSGNHKDGMIRVGGVHWFTNLEHTKRHEKLILYKEYKNHESEYPTYDDYDAINIDKIKDIPKDYFGKMGVPITFLNVHCPEQFEIMGIDRYINDNPNYRKRLKINGKEKYARLIIKRIDNEN